MQKTDTETQRVAEEKGAKGTDAERFEQDFQLSPERLYSKATYNPQVDARQGDKTLAQPFNTSLAVAVTAERFFRLIKEAKSKAADKDTGPSAAAQ